MDQYIKGIERNGNHISLTCECVFNYNQTPNINAFSTYYEGLWYEIYNNGYSKKYHPVEYKYVTDNIRDWSSLIEQHCVEHIKTNKENKRICGGNREC